MVKTKIQAGVCGFVTAIEADAPDGQNVLFNITSDCNNITKLAEILKNADAFNEITTGFDGVVWTAVRANLKGCCSGCAVPAGIYKSMQVAAGLALPADIMISMTKE
jgi:hypothetical protein